MVICTCVYCRTKQVTINGVSQPGCEVSNTTRLDHEKKARGTFEAAVKRQTPSSIPKSPAEVSRGAVPAICAQCIFLMAWNTELVIDTSFIINLCCTLVVWLHLKAGVSRDTANTILKVIQLILSTTFDILQVALKSNLGVNIKLPVIQIPRDIRTAYHISSSEPDII